MSIEERIAKILRTVHPFPAHKPGKYPKWFAEWIEQATPALVTELGLTEEHAIDKPGQRGINPQRRYVTPWETT